MKSLFASQTKIAVSRANCRVRGRNQLICFLAPGISPDQVCVGPIAGYFEKAVSDVGINELLNHNATHNPAVNQLLLRVSVEHEWHGERLPGTTFVRIRHRAVMHQIEEAGAVAGAADG